MSLTLPQEIELWYIIPAIRSALAQEMARQKVRQKDIARQLGITEAAVSQYVRGRRAHASWLPANVRAGIRAAAKRLAKGAPEHAAFVEIQRITARMKRDHSICDMHRQRDKNLPARCDLCFSHSRPRA